MKIRSITCFMNPGWPLNERLLYRAADFVALAKTAFSSSGYEVQTARLATPPFPDMLPGAREAALLEFAVALETTASRLGFKYVSLGPASPHRRQDAEPPRHVLERLGPRERPLSTFFLTA